MIVDRPRPSMSSVRARSAASHEVAVRALLPESVYAARTPCHDRLVQVTEAELERADRQVTVRCPGCSGIWRVSVYAPTVHWQQ